MDIDLLTKIKDIQSFVTLKEIFESLINDGVIDEKGKEILFGYMSLITYPSIYLTKDGAEREISAAKDCYKIVMQYAKDEIKEALTSDNLNKQIAVLSYTLPPEKYMLVLCGEFFLLDYLLNGLYANYTDEQLSEIDGDDYAKVWFTILSKGYHFAQTEEEIVKDHNHFASALRIIIKMHLSLEYKEKTDIENIKRLLEGYYRTQGGYKRGGCLSMVILFIATSLIAACSL